MVITDLPVESQIGIDPALDIMSGKMAVLKYIDQLAVLHEITFLHRIADIDHITIPVIDHSENIDGITTVLEVKSRSGVAVSILKVLIISGSQIETESFSLLSYRPDPYYRRYRSIIHGSRVGYHLYIMDFIRMNIFQFVNILDLTTVDIKDRCTFSDHFQFVIPLRHAGDL